MKKTAVTLLSCFLLISALASGQQIPEPAEFFGHEIGAEGEIIDYARSLEYYQLIAGHSPRVNIRELGKTTDGHPFVLLTISSPDLLADLENILEQRRRLTDPRITSREEAKKIAAEMPAVVFHTGSIHSSEISTAQVPPLVIHRLATSDDPETNFILANTIILFSPSANPDGQFKYNEWYNEHKGQPWEGRMPWLYHSYVGHDDNRDWVFLHFPEQRLTAQHVHNTWNPIYSLEMHEFGSGAARIFVPPYQDPYDYNVAPQVISAMNTLGTAIAHRLTSLDMGGVVQNAHFDLYTPARAYQVYRGTARILTETARGNFARSIEINKEDLDRDIRGTGGYNPAKQSWNHVLPWQGGKWTLRDRVDYQVEANFALMRYAAAHRKQFALALYNGFSHVLDQPWPAGYLIPVSQHDPASLHDLLDLMALGGVEISRLSAPALVDGKEYSAGSFFISLDQPYAAWVKTLFEVQDYPDYRTDKDSEPIPPYDITGHTLPLLMGLTVVELESAEALQLEKAGKPEFALRVPAAGSEGYWFSSASNDAFALANALMADGEDVLRVTGAGDLPQGAFFTNASEEAIRKSAAGLALDLNSLDALPEQAAARLATPRVAIYEPWGGLMDAGWTRKMLEDFNFSFELIRNDDIITGNLTKRFDIILFPNGISEERLLEGISQYPDAYKGGISEQGMENLRQFAESGGYIAAWGRTCETIISLFEPDTVNARKDLERNEYFDPGCIVSVKLDTSHPVNYGMKRDAALVIRYSPLMMFEGENTVVSGRFSASGTRLSGFLLGEQYLSGKPAQATVSVGEGRLILFNTLPQFRCMTHSSYKQLFNAILWAVAE